jgi:hypothetical protein
MRHLLCGLLLCTPTWLAGQDGGAQPTFSDDSLPPTRTFALPWTDGNGHRRVDHLTIDEFMALIDQTGQDQERIATIFELKEQLLEIRKTKFHLLRHRDNPDFDQVHWRRLCREHRRLVKELAAYHARINEHLQRRIDGPINGYQRPDLHRITGNPDRDREYVLGPAADRQPQPTATRKDGRADGGAVGGSD